MPTIIIRTDSFFSAARKTLSTQSISEPWIEQKKKEADSTVVGVGVVYGWLVDMGISTCRSALIRSSRAILSLVSSWGFGDIGKENTIVKTEQTWFLYI